jgi:hypothetical protein
MSYNKKWRKYLDEMELSGTVNIDGKLLPKETTGMFVEGEVYILKSDEDVCAGMPKEITIKKSNGPADTAVVEVPDEKNRNMPVGEIAKCYKLRSGEPETGASGDEENILGESCGEMLGGERSAVLPIAALSKKMGIQQGDSRRVTPHDQEGRSAKEELNKIAKYAVELMEKLHDDDELESWIQAKITKAAAYMSAAKHHLEYEYENPPMMDEYAPMMESTNQKVDKIVNEVKKLKKKHSLISESLAFHRLNNIPITKSFFEEGSEPYTNLVAAAAKLWKKGLYKPNKDEKRIFQKFALKNK